MSKKTKAMAEEAENMREDYFLKAIEYYDRSFNILETREISAGLYSWLTLYGNMLCHYWLDDIEKTAGYLVKLESAVPKIKESLGEGHSILSDIEKMRDWIDGAT